MNHMDDCFAGAPQEFLICITVHKAANTGVFTGELYVKISLDKMSKNTKTHANSENPFFNEVRLSTQFSMNINFFYILFLNAVLCI